jgi:hypothetical protein
MNWNTVLWVCLTAGAGIGLAFVGVPEERSTMVVWGTVGYVLVMACLIVVTERMGWTL